MKTLLFYKKNLISYHSPIDSDYSEKMSIRANVHLSKIIRMPIKLGVCTYAMYTNCQKKILSVDYEI